MRHALLFAGLVAASCVAGCTTPRPELAALPTRPLDACGLGTLAQAGPVDVAIAIDTSFSTERPTGFDVDGDGTVGVVREGVVTDRGDTVLAAQVAGVRSLAAAAEAAAGDVRFAIVTYAGPVRFDDPTSATRHDKAFRRADLGSDPRRIEQALEGILQAGGHGTSDFAAGMRRSLDALGVGRPPASERRRVLLMFAVSPSPIMPGPTAYAYKVNGQDPNGPVVYTDPHMAVQAKRAIRSQVAISTFGLGAAAAAEPPHALSRIAGATGGGYRAITDPVRVECYLLAALVQPR